MNRVFQYIEHGNTAGLISYYGTGTIAEVPAEADGKRITGLEAYAFSTSLPAEQEGVKTYREEQSPIAGELLNLRGSLVTEVRLPSGMERIGNYCFYGCSRLEKLYLTDHLTDIGGGAFTGCRLKRLEIDFYEGEKSCLKDIVAENRYPLRVIMRYHLADGRLQTARILFPEHYEEAVENTPARIVMTHYHGSGGSYRQCFYQRELDYREYDGLFSHAVAWEEQEVLLELVFGRLLYPYRLSEQAKKRYQEYVMSVPAEAARLLVLREDPEGLEYMAAQGLWNAESLEAGIACASETGRIEILSYLMEEKNRLFPARKKVFVW